MSEWKEEQIRIEKIKYMNWSIKGWMTELIKIKRTND